jgi:hypothetical protein
VADGEPYIEALICKPESQGFCDKIDGKSARYFLIDPSNKLVAKAFNRLLVQKEALDAIQPLPWPATKQRLFRFAGWLARRYDRPPFPDLLVAGFLNPLEQILEDLDRTSHGAALHRISREWRLTSPQTQEPPYRVQLTILLDTPTLSVEEANALESVEEAIRNAIDPSIIVLHPVIKTATMDELSVRAYVTTFPIYYEYLSYHGDEQVGALPIKRT